MLDNVKEEKTSIKQEIVEDSSFVNVIKEEVKTESIEMKGKILFFKNISPHISLPYLNYFNIINSPSLRRYPQRMRL